ncbi:MAG: glycosyltransferase family 2 protein [Candidatus Peribacteraceae bacterium]|nr:glycosyltransferase family 2 protein [Candidatus Peribacteraceae bacterium]MDD5742010.1 glycosyltransferase family 2 protein [Candidatus Peribacteraceae bacterium]
MTPRPLLSVILPSYNNGTCLPATIRRIRQTCPKNTEVIIVMDGSTDETSRILARFLSGHPRVLVVARKTRRGKGAAVRNGVHVAHGRYIATIDADMAIDPSYVAQGLAWLQQAPALDIVIARRTAYRTSLVRHIAHAVFHWIEWTLFRMPYHDTQAPMKIFRAPVAKAVFAHMQTRSYAFDIEVLFRTMIRGHGVGELPVLQRKTQSNLRWNLLLFTAIELLRMYRTYVVHQLICLLHRQRRHLCRIGILSLRHIILWPLSWPVLWILQLLYHLQNKQIPVHSPILPTTFIKAPILVQGKRLS